MTPTKIPADALREMLQKIVDRCTRPVPDSTGQGMVKVREALIDQARALLATDEGV